MLHLETLTPEALDLLRRIQSRPEFKDTRLVGGAALGLHFGHRTSLDLDLFGKWEPTPPLELALSKCAGRVVKEGGDERLQFFSADGIKIDCVTYPYDWLKPAVDAEGLRIAAVEDIAAMKIAAATNRGTRKDFVDIYFILRQYPLDVILDWYAAKYPDGNLYLVLRSLVYFDDAEMEPMPNVLEPLDWESVKRLISDSVKALA